MIKSNNNVWYNLNREYCFSSTENQYRIFTNINNAIYDIWLNGRSIKNDGINLENEAQRICNTANIYAVYGMNFECDPNELERVRELQRKRS
jgi:hypothetical protein